MTNTTETKAFNLKSWQRQMLRLTKDAEKIGTKNTNPLVRWKSRHSPFLACPHCRVAFTQLGLPKHVNACKVQRLIFV